MKRELERVEIPGETGARERAWAVARERVRGPDAARQKSHWPRVAAIAIALAAVLASAFSSPGRAVIDEIREVVGVESAQRALFSLPADGRLLITSDAGVWVVQPDGSKRLLGEYREASWSPFGRFVVAARRDELAALEPDGNVRWTLARPGARSPRWAGTESDTRIAYLDDTGIRMVAGDGTGDRLLVPRAPGPLAWRPGGGFVLAYATRDDVRTIDTETGRALSRVAYPGVTDLSWSANGRRLLARSRDGMRVYEPGGASPLAIGPGAAPVQDAELAPGGGALAYAQPENGRSELWTVPRIRPDANAARRLFSGVGAFQDVTWSPDGDWLLVSWPAADQWVFVRADGRGIRAVSNISEQLRSDAFPQVEGWCCAP